MGRDRLTVIRLESGHTADDFATFFRRKVDDVMAATAGQPAPTIVDSDSNLEPTRLGLENMKNPNWAKPNFLWFHGKPEGILFCTGNIDFRPRQNHLMLKINNAFIQHNLFTQTVPGPVSRGT